MESNIDILTRTQAPLFYFYGLVLHGDSFIVMQRLLNEKKDEKRPRRSLYRCRLLRHLYVLPTIRFVHQLERNHQTIDFLFMSGWVESISNQSRICHAMYTAGFCLRFLHSVYNMYILIKTFRLRSTK